MNIQEMDIMKSLAQKTYISQRDLSNSTGYSLGMINQSLKSLELNNLIDSNNQLTSKGKNTLKQSSPERAIILAAGFGMRMVPINLETPKALIEIKGEALIDRLIKQLHEVGIKEIYVIVGFMKEQLEYLIDDFNVSLIVNPYYSSTNNLHSLNLANDKISNTYIIPCDLWCEKNPFNKTELYSWYMVKSSQNIKSEVRVNRKKELVLTKNDESGNPMVGISYISKFDAPVLKENLSSMNQDPQYNQSFWEDALFGKSKITTYAKIVSDEDVIEINSYEQLRELDSNSNQLKSKAIDTICRVLNTTSNNIHDIKVLKKGMTNRSFLFKCYNEKYIMRIPGEGTDKLINRKEEAEVYAIIKGRNICDDVVYINPENGYKITKYITASRVCDPYCKTDLQKCMKVLKDFHTLKLHANHEFNIWDKINFYESLWDNQPSVYRDYKNTKENVFSLRGYIEKHIEEKVLTHIDAVPDNFLFYFDNQGKEHIRLIDWEYAGLQDPHVDIAMFCIYAMYDKSHVDQLIDIYFENKCTNENRAKIYCYIASCGLLWSNWCEYKRNLGVEFGEYSLYQYRYAKDFYKFAREKIKECEEC